MIAGGKLLTAEQSSRLAVLDPMDRQQVIERIVCGLRKAAVVCEWNQFGGASPDAVWRFVNGVRRRYRGR